MLPLNNEDNNTLFQFLPESIFLSKTLSFGLLSLTILCLAIFCMKWIKEFKAQKLFQIKH
jgi:hypothetical protein